MTDVRKITSQNAINALVKTKILEETANYARSVKDKLI